MPSYRDFRRTQYHTTGYNYASTYNEDESGYDYGYECSHHHEHDGVYADGPSFKYGPRYGLFENQHADYSILNNKYGLYARVNPSSQGTHFFEEHCVVHGNSTRNGPYLHENCKVQHEDGPYHAHCLWDANCSGYGHHVHRGSYGMDRNSHQDIHYDYEAEYYLEHPSGSPHSGQDSDYIAAYFRSDGHQKSQTASSRNKTSRGRKATPFAFKRPSRMGVYGGGYNNDNAEYHPSEREWGQDDWRSEHHFFRRNGVTGFRDDSYTESQALASAWIMMDRYEDHENWRSRLRSN